MFQRLMRWWLNRHYPMDKLVDAAHSAAPPNGHWPIPGPNFDPLAHVNWQHLHDLNVQVPHPHGHDAPADVTVDCVVTHGNDHHHDHHNHDPVVVCDVHGHDAGPADSGPPPSPPND
jgi:hypothetical protein